MRIGIMLRHFGQQGGIGVYTANIVASLLELDSSNQYTLFYRDSRHLGHFSAHPNVTECVISAPNRLLWDQVAIPRAARKKKLDLIYNPKLSIPLSSPCETVLVMHGAEQFAVPEAFMWHDRIYFTLANRLYCKRASAIVTMTHTGAKDIAKYMGADPSKIHVIYESYNENCRILGKQQTRKVREAHALPERFILFVGGLNPIKNLRRLILAYEKIYRELPQKLVVVGFRRWKYSDDLELIDRLGLRDHIVFTNFIPDDDIPAMYNLADAFIFPSLYEGFGMPVLEAMACGCPVVTTKTGCSPEVAGDAAILVDPYSPDEIADAIRKVVTNQGLKEQLKVKGLHRAQQFRWEKCAATTLALFESFADGGEDNRMSH